jgi:hypothetical protein
MTLRRLQTLVRLQADSIAVKKASSHRKSMEQVITVPLFTARSSTSFNFVLFFEQMVSDLGLIQVRFAMQVRISEQKLRLNPPSTPVHRRRLSDSTDSNYERSPRVVEMNTCHLRSRSSRMASCYTPDQHSTEYRPAALAPSSCSPLPGRPQPARLSFRRSSQHHDHERDPRGSKAAHNTPRFVSAQPYDSPAKSSVEYGPSLTSTPRRTPHRDTLVSPRYMAGTASSAARTRCHSAPRQRQQQTAEAARAGARTRSCPHENSGLCSQCSDLSRRTPGCSDLSVDDEAVRDYYLDSLW